MKMSRRFSIRLPRATFLMASLALLFLAAAPAAKAQPFTQISLAGVLNLDANAGTGEYGGDFRTGSVTNQTAPPPNTVTGPPGLTFAIPTSGNNVYNTAVGAPAVGNVTSPLIPIGVAGVTTVYALVNGILGTTPATFTFNATGGVSQTFTLLPGRDYRDFNNDGGTNTTTGQLPANGMLTGQFYGTAPGGAANGQSLHRLDLITFTLAPAFLTQTLQNLQIVDMGQGNIVNGVKLPGTSRIFLAGLVDTGAVPEPGPIALAAVAGLAGLVGYGRRYRGMVAGWFNREPKVG